MGYRRLMLTFCGGGALLGAVSYGHRDFRVVFDKRQSMDSRASQDSANFFVVRGREGGRGEGGVGIGHGRKPRLSSECHGSLP